MTQKIIMLEINWEMGKARTTFYEGKGAFQQAESDLCQKERDGSKDWVRTLFFGPKEFKQ
jgi:hypothetical protein